MLIGPCCPFLCVHHHFLCVLSSTSLLAHTQPNIQQFVLVRSARLLCMRSTSVSLTAVLLCSHDRVLDPCPMHPVLYDAHARCILRGLLADQHLNYCNLCLVLPSNSRCTVLVLDDAAFAQCFAVSFEYHRWYLYLYIAYRRPQFLVNEDMRQATDTDLDTGVAKIGFLVINFLLNEDPDHSAWALSRRQWCSGSAL